jgi:eukaryotic-like serine/threonine-protein kinase
MGADGESPKKLLQAAAGDRFLQTQWAPDGQRIAYIKSHIEGDKTETTIETLPLTGGVGTRLLDISGLGSFCWSAGGRIIYSAAEPPPSQNNMNLWEVPVDRSGVKTIGPPRRITTWVGLSLLDLSLSQDGKRLIFVKAGFQRDLYLAQLQSKDVLGPPRRFTLEGRNDLPSAWTPDGQRLFFYSDRTGNWDIFRQGLQERRAQDFVLGPGEQIEPRLSPDASWVLYWDYVQGGIQKSPPMRLMRIPISGGAPETVLQAVQGASVRCAPRHPPCILSEPDRTNGELVFSSFDLERGRMAEVIRLAADPSGLPAWDLSPDGSTVAIVDLDEHKEQIRLVEVNSGSSRAISCGRSANLSGISWSADGSGWFVTNSSPREAAILHVSLTGAVSKLWTTSTSVGTPLASPDGRNLAFSLTAYNSNVWVIENL